MKGQTSFQGAFALVLLLAANLVLALLVEYLFLYTLPQPDANAAAGYQDSTIVHQWSYPKKGCAALVETPEGERHTVLLDRHSLFPRYRVVRSGTGPVEDGDSMTVMASLTRMYRIRVAGDQIRCSTMGLAGGKALLTHYGLWCVGLTILEALVYDGLSKIFRR